MLNKILSSSGELVSDRTISCLTTDAEDCPEPIFTAAVSDAEFVAFVKAPVQNQISSLTVFSKMQLNMSPTSPALPSDQLAAVPNEPVLTDVGFVPAGPMPPDKSGM